MLRRGWLFRKEREIKRAFWVLVSGFVFLLVLAAGLVFAYRPEALRVLGTGGLVSRTVKGAPHPFTFSAPRFWPDETNTFSDSGVIWDAAFYGPSSKDGVLLASLHIRLRPAASPDVELRNSGGSRMSLEDFVRMYLPREYEISSDTSTSVDGRNARDMLYRYVFYGGSPDFPATRADCRGRVVFFEDRGYYYMLSYDWSEDEYGRYAEVFDRVIKTFKFLD